MNFNICIIQPPNYIHSAAFAELGEVVGYALQDLGHNVALNVNQTFKDAKNIILGCHLLDPSLIKQTPKDSIVINTEQIYKDETAWNKNVYEWVTNFTTWDYSESNILKLKEIGAKNIQYLRIGYHKKLERITKPKTQDIDVLFYGSINERRKVVIEQLTKLGINIQTVFGVYGEERDKLISRSKIILNHHHYNSKIFEIVRVFYLMTNSKAVVAEIDSDTQYDKMYEGGVFASSYDSLATNCQH
jgi:hypothetical protein